MKRHGSFWKKNVRDFKEEFGTLFPVRLVSIPPRFAVITNNTVEDRPILTTFRYKQANTINSVFQLMWHEKKVMWHEILLEIDSSRCNSRVARNVTLLVLVALRLVRASKTTEGRSSNTTPLSSSTATPPFPRLWSHFIDTGRNKERAMGRCAHATGLWVVKMPRCTVATGGRTSPGRLRLFLWASRPITNAWRLHRLLLFVFCVRNGRARMLRRGHKHARRARSGGVVLRVCPGRGFFLW